jgi:GNAT superfamily N-acetyltransferase
LREAAEWALSRGVLVWREDELCDQDFVEAASADELVIGFDARQPVATMLLQKSDPIYWPEVVPNSSLFLHKIAVRRAHAGRDWLGRLLEFAEEAAHEGGNQWLRLDTLPEGRLRGIYEQHGFSVADAPPVTHQGRTMIRMQRPVGL